MLKLFRNIRKKQLADSRFGKYLLYAIGEIILVVIGILIAISLNNSNQKKNEKKLVAYKLKQLRQEVYQDSLEIAHIIQFYDSRIEITQTLLKKMEQYEPRTDCGATLSLLREFEQLRNAVGKDGTYNDMLNTGLFSKIEDEELKQDIIDYYKHQSNFRDITWDYVKQFKDIKNDLIKHQIFELRYHQDERKIRYQDYCDYVDSLFMGSNKKLAFENYLYKGLETQKGIKNFYVFINNHLIKGIPKN